MKGDEATEDTSVAPVGPSESSFYWLMRILGPLHLTTQFGTASGS